MNVFGKPLKDLTPQDVEDLISGTSQEGQYLEFKSITEANLESGNTEKLAALVAIALIGFANSEGGTLIIGVKEDKENTPPFKIEAAKDPGKWLGSLLQQLKELVDPILPSLDHQLINVGADTGIVIFVVTPSYRAPHRYNKKGQREAYVRRQDRTDAISMTEIQDITLRMSRRIDRFENRLKELSQRQAATFETFSFTQNGLMLSLTMVPTNELEFTRDQIRKNLSWERESFSCTEHDRNTGKQTAIADLSVFSFYVNPKPILKGTFISYHDTPELRFESALYTDGSYTSTMIIKEDKRDPRCSDCALLHLSWLLVFFGHNLSKISHIKNTLGQDTTEYGVQATLITKGTAKFAYGDRYIASQPIPTTHIAFPTYSASNKSELESVFTELMQDFIDVTSLTRMPAFQLNIE